jgi:ribosomal protein S18 acetylase RimI-like enzyme
MLSTCYNDGMEAIRELRPNDKTELLDIMTVFYASPALIHHTPRNTLEKVVDDCLGGSPYVQCFVCESDGHIVGYTVAALGYSTEYGGMSVMIEDLCVVADMRGRGIGEKLLRFVETRYRKKAVRLRLEVEPNNARAISLYRKLGFGEVGYLQMSKEFI